MSGFTCRSAECDDRVLARDSFTAPHEGPAGERLVSIAICDASKSLAGEEAIRRAVLGASAVLLLITDRDDPAVVDRRLTATYAACQQKVRIWPGLCHPQKSRQHDFVPRSGA